MRNVNADAKERQAASKRHNDLYRTRSEFVTEDRTGFVWLYLQKRSVPVCERMPAHRIAEITFSPCSAGLSRELDEVSCTRSCICS